jgi:EpsI family protein
MTWRAIVVSLLMFGGSIYIAGASRAEAVPPRESFATFPRVIGQWMGREAPPLAEDVLAVLGADEHVNRVYSSTEGPVGLYIGYYGSQRQGDTIHSPLNCLPGAGWQPVSKEYVDVAVASDDPRARGGFIRVNQIVVQKGLDRQLVLYWYQSHGRVVPNEYWSKLFMVYDAFRLNRSDAALVRVVSPMIGSNDHAEPAAAGRARSFVGVLFPLLEKYLPA